MDRTIDAVRFEESELTIYFDTGGIKIYDNGQSCCENRYLTCDDNLDFLVGAEYLGTESKSGPVEDDDYDIHETMFVEVKTTKGSITLTTHNIHNGYYGGFNLKVEEFK